MLNYQKVNVKQNVYLQQHVLKMHYQNGYKHNLKIIYKLLMVEKNLLI